MSAKPPFYVYRIRGQKGLLYIGKGMGPRVQRSARRCKGRGKIIARFSDETKAFAFEKRLITKFTPPMNRRPGGCGGMARAEVLARRAKHEANRLFESRQYVARFLLRLNYPFTMDQVQKFMRVAWPIENSDGSIHAV